MLNLIISSKDSVNLVRFNMGRALELNSLAVYHSGRYKETVVQ